MKSIADNIPSVAWHRRLDAVLEKAAKPSRSFTPKMLWHMLPFIIRLQRLMKKKKNSGFDPINLFNPPHPGAVMGVPLGGIGGGSITRGWQGDFRRWALRPGIYQHQVAYADQFSLFVQREKQPAQAQVLYPKHPEEDGLQGWKWDMNPACATYHALFPRAWTTYENPLPGVRLTCRQISPIIANNYKESSYPAAVFHWKVENTGMGSARIGLLFTFQNGTGGKDDLNGGHHNEPFQLEDTNAKVVGVSLHHQYRQEKSYPYEIEPGQREHFEDPLTLAMAALATPMVEISYQTRFDCGDGSQIWEDFSHNGALPDTQEITPSAVGQAIGAGLAGTVTLAEGQAAEIVFSLAWDMPIVHSGYGRAYRRRYTLFYGSRGDAAPALARDALLQYGEWERMIEKRQAPILKDAGLPDWFKMALFNELYYISDGGTLWAYPAQQKKISTYSDMGHFAYLEGHEYRMYNTYDVHFYASFALAMNWPKLELSLQRDFAAAALVEYPDRVKKVYDGKMGRRKTHGMVPHDLGWPDEDMWVLVNGYFMHDVNEWKDLNAKFVLQVYRDYVLTRDRTFLQECWPALETAIYKLSRFDHDQDGLIENSGFPDQTYDTWRASGASAYTGGLWLACLLAGAEMARLVNKSNQEKEYLTWFTRGQVAYESKLWNGKYFNYDSSHSQHHDSIMADMLAGQWYARACGLPPIIKPAHIQSALKTIFNYNVMGFQKGGMGAVNGTRPDGRVDRSNMQSQEVWAGTSFSLAASLLQEGLINEGWRTARGVVDTIYEKKGYWFQTPEAWDANGNYRSLAYMRPLSIWAMLWAWQILKRSK